MKKLNWKKIIGWGIVVLGLGFVIYFNTKDQESLQNSGKKNVYAVLPLSGQMAQTGKEAQQVMDYYYKKGNYPFNLIYIDSETNPTKAITALQQKTINDDNPIVIAALTGITEALAPYVRQKNGFLFSITATNKNIPDFLRLHSNVDGMLKATVSYLKKYHKVALVYIEDQFGRLEGNYVVQQLKNANISVDEISIPLQTLDVRTEVVKLKSFNPDAVIIMGTPTQGYINIVRELVTQGFKGQIFLDPGITAPQFRKQLPNGIMGSCLLLELENPQNEKQQQFINNVNTLGFNVFVTLIEAVDTMNLIKYTIENNLPFSQETYEKMKNWEGISGNIEFLPNGETAYQYILVRYQDGKFIPVESEEKEN